MSSLCDSFPLLQRCRRDCWGCRGRRSRCRRPRCWQPCCRKPVGDAPPEQELTPFSLPSSQVQEEGPRQQALHHPPHVQRPHAVPQALCQLQRGEDHQGACSPGAEPAAWLPSPARLPPCPGPARSPWGTGAQGGAPERRTQSGPRTAVFLALPQPLPGRGVCPTWKVRVSLRGSATSTGREALVPRALFSVSIRRSSARWPLVERRAEIHFLHSGLLIDVLCHRGLGTCSPWRSLVLWFGAGHLSEPQFPHGPWGGLAWVGIFPDRCCAERWCCIGQEVLRARLSSGTGKRFSLRAFSEPLFVYVAFWISQRGIYYEESSNVIVCSHSFFAFTNS